MLWPASPSSAPPLEEISWGQRLFDLETPALLLEHNKQDGGGEITLHNLEVASPFLHEAYVLVGLAGGLGWLLYLTPLRPGAPVVADTAGAGVARSPATSCRWRRSTRLWRLSEGWAGSRASSRPKAS